MIIDNLSNSSIKVLDQIEKITGTKPGFEKIDLKAKHEVNRFFNRHGDIDGIIHFAAHKAVGESVGAPLKYYENNITSLINLLEELVKLGSPKLIFSSSCTVYGRADKLPINESSPIKVAESPYGNTKIFMNKLLKTVVKLIILYAQSFGILIRLEHTILPILGNYQLECHKIYCAL